MVRLITEIKALPGYHQQVQNLLLDLLEPTRNEHGCCQYELYQDPATEGLFIIEEMWCSQKSLNLHHTSEHLLEFKINSERFLDFIQQRPLRFIA